MSHRQAAQTNIPARHLNECRQSVPHRPEERETVANHSTVTSIQSIVGELAGRAATPRDVIEVHLLAVRPWAEAAQARRSRAIVSAAESVLTEAMGYLAAYYRDAALGNGLSHRYGATA